MGDYHNDSEWLYVSDWLNSLGLDGRIPGELSYDGAMTQDAGLWQLLGFNLKDLKSLWKALFGRNTTKGGSSWVYGTFKSETKWANQFAKRGWTPEQVTEAIMKGEKFDAVNMVNKGNAAIRYVHPTTGKSVVIDNVTKELLQVGGEGFQW